MTEERAYAAQPIVGYSDPLCVAAGEPIRFMVSTTAAAFDATLLRLRHGDRHPDGPGVRSTEVPSAIDGQYPGGVQPLPLGSHVRVAGPDPVRLGAGRTVAAWIRPTVPDRGPQGVLSRWEDGRGWGLYVDGDLCLRLGGTLTRTGAPLRPGVWTFVAAVVDPDTSRVMLHQRPTRETPDDPARATVSAEVSDVDGQGDVPLLIGDRFNGKIDRPRLFDRALSDAEIDALASGADVHAGLVAAWTLGARPDSTVVPDPVGGHDGVAVNSPTAAVTGHNWRGEQVAFHAAPDQYDALSFHDDDLDDACWAPAFELTVPADLPSGVYAVRLRAAGAEDQVPFVVSPPRGTATSDVAVLAPTMSWLAYANNHGDADNPVIAGTDLASAYQPVDRFMMEIPLTGLYDHHADGSGVGHASWRQPILNMRPDYHLPLIRSAHQFPADLHLIDWLAEKAVAHDVVTDHDLHREGVDLLARYRVVLTGSHPEYWTAPMLDALESYLDSGGRLMYLGGNGFYWVTTVSPSRPYLIEVRRGRRGTGTWRSEPGEDWHATTGEPGGLWRDRGRPPQRLVGVGMAAQGFDEALPYRVVPGHERAAWVLDGVDPADPIGATGIVMGGAAGLEIDRADPALGSPPNLVRIATATGFSDSYQHVVEEVAGSDSKQGGSVCGDVRADLVVFENPHGGAVFSTGSIAWCGSLSSHGYDNPVSRITENVLRRFRS